MQRFEVWLVNLDPSQSSEIYRTRPCVVLSPDEKNRYLRTVTSGPDQHPARLPLPSRLCLPGQGGAGRARLYSVNG